MSVLRYRTLFCAAFINTFQLQAHFREACRRPIRALCVRQSRGDMGDVGSSEDSAFIHSQGEGPKSSEKSKISNQDDRKEAKRQAKADRRARREGRLVVTKNCDICSSEVTLLIRCQTDATRAWRMVCGKCWHRVSGGVKDGSPDHPYYRYGGLWKAK